MTGLIAPLWPGGRTTAVSLTYDDCLPVHRQLVAPLLDGRGIAATFYVPVGAADLQENVREWRAIAAAGHELGNHSMFHPCRTDVRPEARVWLPVEYDLADYTPRRWRDEMASANFVLGLIDGCDRRTFGNTCNEIEIGRGELQSSLDPLIAELFIAGRGAMTDRPVDPREANLMALGCCRGDDKYFHEFRAEIESAAGSWLIFEFHGVGHGTHDLFVDSREHQRLIDHLAAHSATVWTAPVVQVASHLADRLGTAVDGR